MKQILKAVTFAIGFYIIFSLLDLQGIHIFAQSFFTPVQFTATIAYAFLEFELIKY